MEGKNIKDMILTIHGKGIHIRVFAKRQEVMTFPGRKVLSSGSKID
jgi:hypothetical protein